MSSAKKQRDLAINSLRHTFHLPFSDDVVYQGLVDQTNTVHLRTRKPKDRPKISSFLEKVAKVGQYDVPLGHLPMTQIGEVTPTGGDATSASHATPTRPRIDPVPETIEFRRKVDLSGKHKAKSIALKRRKVEPNLPYPLGSTATHNSYKRLSIKSWRADVLSHLSGSPKDLKTIKKLVWNGVPSSIRAEVWSRLIGNRLNIDKTLYNHCLRLSDQHLIPTVEIDASFIGNSNLPVPSSVNADCPTCAFIFANINTAPIRQELCFYCPHTRIDSLLTVELTSFMSANSRICRDRTVCLRSVNKEVSLTFHTMRLFQSGCPFHTQLHNLLAAFVVYQPHIGYLPGMSYLAAVLLLVVPDPFDSFVLFANILDKPCHRAYYNPDESEFVIYFRAFNQLLSDRVPRLHAHFVQVGLEPNMYLFDWLFTIFSRILPLEAALRVWDVFCAEGDIVLFRVALTLLLHFQRDLMRLPFNHLVSFLTNRLPLDVTGDQLMKLVYSVRLKRRVWTRYLARARSGYELHSSVHDKTVSFALSSPKHPTSLSDFGFRNTMENIESQDSISHDTTGLPVPDPRRFRPGPVDHSTRSLYSPGSTISADLSEEQFDQPIRHDSVHPFTTDWVEAVNWDSGQKTPWTVGPHASPFHRNVFTFDEVPFSAPPDSQIRSPRRWNFSRWASEWALTELDKTKSTRQNIQAASSHDLRTHKSCASLPRRAASLHHIKPPLFHRSHSKLRLNEKPKLANMNDIVPLARIPYELIP